MIRRILIITVVALLAISNACTNMKERADLIIHNAIIYTVDENFSIAEAMAVKDGKILATGSNDEIVDSFVADKTWDAEGNAVYPGFIDGHCHFYWYGAGLLQNADLAGTESFDEILGILKEHHQKQQMEWVLGRGWDQNDWEVQEYPDKKRLDELFPDNPVVLTRIDGHAVLANSEALKRAEITADTKIEGGEVVKDENGEPTGILIDNAADALKELVPQLNREEQENALDEAQKNCFAVGLTSVVDAGLDTKLVTLIDSLQQSGKLKMKINTMLSPTAENYEHFIKNGPYVTDKLSVRAIKLFADGALGSRGALLLKDYSDDPGNKGLMMKDTSYYREWAEKANNNGYQLCTHTIGDAAARIILDVYAEELEENNDKRWRIEHAQIINPDDMEKFGKYAVIPSIQGTHATSDMYWAGDRIGDERITHAYAFRELLQENGWIINGTDFPIEKIDPLHTFYATVARKDLKGYPDEGFLKENALNREETLKSMTIWAARGSFEEDKKGSLEAGKQADFVILDKNIMEVEEDMIPEAEILRTYSDGILVYEKK